MLHSLRSPLVTHSYYSVTLCESQYPNPYPGQVIGLTGSASIRRRRRGVSRTVGKFSLGWEAFLPAVNLLQWLSWRPRSRRLMESNLGFAPWQLRRASQECRLFRGELWPRHAGRTRAFDRSS